MTRALVTGGAGFVGRHLIRRLLEDGFDVVCVDSLDTLGGGCAPVRWPLFDPTKFKNFKFEHEDCRAFFARCRERFDLVFHLAAIIGGRRVIEDRPFAVAQNLSIDAEFWQWVSSIECGLVVYMSSSAVFPVELQTETRHVLLREDMFDAADTVGKPDLTYGWSKMSGEYLMRIYTEKLGRPALAFRPFSGYGEDQPLEYPVPSICRRLKASIGASAVTVWGSGRQERDFIHIDDAVDFVLRCCSTPPLGGVINLSSGRPVPFTELARLVANILGYDPVVCGTPGTPEGVFSRCGDRTLQHRLGLLPAISLNGGLRRCVEFETMRVVA